MPLFILREIAFFNRLFLCVLLFVVSLSVGAQTYPVPAMLLPSSGGSFIQTGQNPCFSWTKVTDSRFKSYVITVSLSTNFPTQRWAYDITSSSTTSVCWNGGSGWVPKGTAPLPITDAMKVGVTYYWRALATYNDGSTVTGTEVTGIPFTIIRPTPSPVSPSNGATITSSSQNPCFSWSMPANADFGYYTITLSTTTNFPATRWAYQINSISTTSLCWNNGSGWASKGTSPPPAPGPLQNGVTYYWRVLATFVDGSITGTEFVGHSFVFRASSSSSSLISSSVTSSRSSSSSPLSSSRSSSSSSLSSSARSSDGVVYVRPVQPINAVGSTPYSVDVDHKGEAVVSIPINLAPGINGMHPQISLVYNSGGTTAKIQNQTAGGLLGYGWSLSGISSIDRCTVGKADVLGYISPANKTWGTQSMRPKLKYDDTDNLCLDGELLVLVSGIHLRNGAQYRTYKESYRLITYKEFYDADAKKNAIKFEVRNPNGSVAVYGGSESSRVQKLIYEPYYMRSDRTPIFTWSITSETDSFGNQISYYYRKWEAFSYQANRQRVFPTSIVYPGGTVNFGYLDLNVYGGGLGNVEDDGEATGPDRWRNNHDGGDQLISIRTENKTYGLLGSDQTRDQLRTHGLKLSGVQECGSSIYMQNDHCLPPIKLEWLTRTTAYPEFPQVTSKYYEVGFLGAVVDSLGRKTEFQYDKIYGAYATNMRSKFSEYPLPLVATTSSGTYSRTHGNKDADEANEIGFVVIQLKKGMGISNTPYILNYLYRGAGSASSTGKGFLGFPAVRIQDVAKGLFTYKIYEISKSPYGPPGLMGDIAAIHTYTGIYGSGEKPISKNEYRYEIKNLVHNGQVSTYLPVVSQITDLAYEGGVLIGATTKTNNYEMINNQGQPVTKIISNTKVGAQLLPLTYTPRYYCDTAPHALDPTYIKSEKITTTQLGSYSSATDWRIGFTSEYSEVSYNGAAGTAQATDTKSKTVKYTLMPGSTKVETEIHFPGDAENERTVTYTYNAKGQQESMTLSGKNIETRKTQMLDYFPGTSIPQRNLNAYGHETIASDLDIRFNLPKRTVDANGLATTTTWDAFGRPAIVIDEDGVSTSQTYYSCTTNYCESVPGKLQAIQPVYYKEVLSPITPRMREYYDLLGRVIRTETQGFSGETILSDVQYDEFGLVYKTSMPYVSGATIHYETRAYDLLNRIKRIDKPDGSITTTSYSTENIVPGEAWLKVLQTENIRGADGYFLNPRRKLTYFNSNGKLVRVVDADGTNQAVTTQYGYDALGNVNKTRIEGGIDGSSESTATYDNAGNRISLTDPNAGTIISRYTALGELRMTTDAEGKVTTYRFDKLGRLDLRISDDGTFNWYYDSPGSKGKLAYEHDNKGYSKTYKYLNARLETIETMVAVPGLPARTFTETVKYDNYGRPQKTTYPSAFAVTQGYNNQGYVSGLSYGDNLYSLWNITKQGVFGVEDETLLGSKTTRTFDPKTGRLETLQANNGAAALVQNQRYYWYSNGSLDRRTNLLRNLTDTFNYDNHDRLNTTGTSDVTTGLVKRSLTQQYNNLGNVTSNTSSKVDDLNVTGYQYGTTTNAGPHALSNVSIQGVPHQLYYNRNGAITQYDAPGASSDKFIAYNTGNLPVNITLGTSLTDSNPTARDEFKYAPDGSRYYKKSTYQQNGVLRTEHTYYAGDYEVTLYDSSAPLLQSAKTRIGRLLVIQNTALNGSVTELRQVLHLDYQGSVDAVTNGNTTVEALAFEPFGSRRSPDWLSNITTSQLSALLGKQDKLPSVGYTGHEALDRTGFIHMNGRVYDPRLGRFLSPDPLVQAPTNSQSWNRYSYVFNNPMKYVDPSGYQAVEEVEVNGQRCGEKCQRDGWGEVFHSMFFAANTSNATWENFGDKMYNIQSTQGAILYEMARGMSISSAYLKVAVAGGGSKTSTNNVLGALIAAGGMTQSQVDQMTPSDVVSYWASGKGGSLYFSPNSNMSKIFSQGQGAKVFKKYLFDKYNGAPTNLAEVTKFAYKFTWKRALQTANSAEHAVGSWENGHAGVVGDKVLFSISNTMGANSLVFGRQLGEYGIVPVGKTSSDLHMTIEWNATVSGE